ncbi:MAG: glucose-1-phosphate cytidylyltransferase [Lewinellaceae bacterium]|nr:glucose-1-phosphate cytidylyltransferase [Phaeodactylibacter sp.]MCB9035964.1 glucose-1-phosphate cytidylyltransferase [Lewinellaceae bacterium]
MKVVLFCGGQGTRLRDYSEAIPKPMVHIGYRPILWNIMKYYAHFGHKDFILALGYKADTIKDYFVNYDETISNDFVFSRGGKTIELLSSDIEDWRITFVDTGIQSNIGMRLMRVREHLEGEELFLANYADGLSDLDLPEMIARFRAQPDKVGSFMTYQPASSFHIVRTTEEGLVAGIAPIAESGLWINTGYFLFRQEIFDYINYGEELVVEPFQRLIREQKLTTYKHQGFWQAMDTFKDKMLLDDMQATGNTPWEVWNPAHSLFKKPFYDSPAIRNGR